MILLLLFYLGIRMDVLRALIVNLLYWWLVLTFTRYNSCSEVETLLALVCDVLHLTAIDDVILSWGIYCLRHCYCMLFLLLRKLVELLFLFFLTITLPLSFSIIAKVRFPRFHLQPHHHITTILHQLTRWARLLHLRWHRITTLFIYAWVDGIETQLTHAWWRWEDLGLF